MNWYCEVNTRSNGAVLVYLQRVYGGASFLSEALLSLIPQQTGCTRVHIDIFLFQSTFAFTGIASCYIEPSFRDASNFQCSPLCVSGYGFFLDVAHPSSPLSSSHLKWKSTDFLADGALQWLHQAESPVLVWPLHLSRLCHCPVAGSSGTAQLHESRKTSSRQVWGWGFMGRWWGVRGCVGMAG